MPPPPAGDADAAAARAAWESSSRASGTSVSDEVLDVVRAKIFRPGTHPNRAMREVWSERRGWFFPTKEELFRQQCVVSDSLKRSNRAMTLELERALDALRRRDEHVDVLERSLAQLSLEWFRFGEENKRLASAREADLARRREGILARVKNMLRMRAWRKWRDEVNASLRRAAGDAVESAEGVIREVREEKRRETQKVRTLEKHVEDRRARFVRTMLRLPMSRAFRTWRDAVGAIKVEKIERRATEAEAKAETVAVQAERAMAKTTLERDAESETLRDRLDDAERDLRAAREDAAETLRAVEATHAAALEALRAELASAKADARASAEALKASARARLEEESERRDARERRLRDELRSARDETRSWREAAERGWAVTQRKAHAALRRKTLRARYRCFALWRDATREASSLARFRAIAAEREEAHEAKVAALEAEAGSLRLFRDAMAASDRTMIARKGGGFVPLEEYVKIVEARVGAAALEEALAGKEGGEAAARRYGLEGALRALRNALTSGSGAEDARSSRGGGGGGGFLRAGSNSSPGGSTTTWARAPPRPERRARGVRPKASDANAEEDAANAEEDASDDLRWARVFGGDGNAGPASRGGDADGGSAAASKQRRYRRPYRPPRRGPETALRVTYAPRRGTRHVAPGERLAIASDGARLGAAGGAGAGAATRRRMEAERRGAAAARKDGGIEMRVAFEGGEEEVATRREARKDALAHVHLRATKPGDVEGPWTRALAENSETLAEEA
jgi:hypothetical protein